MNPGFPRRGRPTGRASSWRACAPAAVLVALAAAAASAHGIELVGPEFVLGDEPASRVIGGHVAVLSDGQFVITWAESERGEPAGEKGRNLFAARFSSTGARVSDSFQVNYYGTSSQSGGDVAAGRDGSFVVVWQSKGSLGSDTSDYSVQSRHFDAAMQPTARDRQLNREVFRDQFGVTIEAEPDGGYLALWENRYTPDDLAVRARLMSSDGEPFGAELAVSTRTDSSNEGRISMAIGADGEGLAVWSAIVASQRTVEARRYRSGHGFLGAQFQVNEPSDGTKDHAAVVADPRGGFVVAWRRRDPFDDVLRRVNADGTPVGGELAMGIVPDGPPKLAVDRAGRLVVGLTDDSEPPSDPSRARALVRAVDEDLTLLGDAFQINSYTYNDQGTGDVAFLSGNEGIALITPDGGLVQFQGMRARRFRLVVPPLFEEAFESGGFGEWDEVAP